MAPLNILMINVEQQLARRIAALARTVKLNCIQARSNNHLQHVIHTEKPSVIIYFSSRKSVGESLTPIQVIRSNNETVPIIFLTRHSSETRAIAAIRAGVNDYFKSPFSETELFESILRNIRSAHQPAPAVEKLTHSIPESGSQLVGQSKPMRDILEYIPRVASTDSTVLITGETGTGKELVAGLIHHKSTRRKEPMVRVNCAALPDSLVESELFGYDRGAFTGAMALKRGKFEYAGQGSVFLDEIGDMSPYAQAKILTSIESKEICRLGGNAQIPLNFRIIAATNRDPEEMISEGKFRQDLYYRLNVVRMHLPPLRQRKEDIPYLITHFINRLNEKNNCSIQGLTAKTVNSLMGYDWPGNVRELMNLIEATYVSLPGNMISLKHLPAAFRNKLKDNGSQTQNERSFIVSTLISTKWKKAAAARKLNWSRMTLYRKMTKYKIVEKRSPER